MAVDARRKIREQIAQGASDSTVRDFFVSRYGQYVSFRPPTDGWAMALWAFPFALLVGVGALIGLGRFKQRKRDLTPVPDDRSQDDA
jgi:cytochrome c-type biogenesis protein CcmH